MSRTSKDSDSPFRPAFMLTMIFLLLTAGLTGCKHKVASSSSSSAGPGTAGAEGVTGIPGFVLGSNLADNFELKPQEDGTLMYFDPNYTSIPPFATLSVYAMPSRLIYSIHLKSPPGVDPEVCGALAKSLGEQYGYRQDSNSVLFRTSTFGTGDRTCTLQLTYADASLELIYSTTQTNH